MKKLSRKNLRSILMLSLIIVLLAGILGGCGRNGEPDETVNKLPEASSTPSESVTPTDKPTEPPTEPPAKVVMGTVTTDNLNIRSNPVSDSTIIRQLKENDRVEIIEQQVIDGVNWGRIEEGWINLNYVIIDGQTAPDPTDPPAPIEPDATEPKDEEKPVASGKTGTVTASELNIRKDAGSQYDSLGKYKQGDKVTIIETKNGWGRTSKGWISMSYVKLDSTTTDPDDQDDDTDTSKLVTDGKTKILGYGVVEEVDTLNVRKGPGTKYDKVTSIPAGQRLPYYQKSGNWVRLADGWVSLTYFDTDEKIESGTKGTVNTAELNIRKDAGSKYDSVGKYKKGDVITILDVKNNWGKTDKGWVSLNYVILESDGTTGSSSKIESDGKTKILGYGIVEGPDNLNVRTGPGTKYDKITILQPGQRLPYYQKSGNWVRTNEGWVSLTYFDTDEEIKSGTKATVLIDKLDIHKDASASSDVVATYKKGDKITILQVKNNWGKTDKGWVSLARVDLNTDDETESNAKIESDGKTKVLGYGVVTSGSLNLRTGPSTEKDDIGTLDKGDRAAYYQKDGKWVRTKNGWVSTTYFYLEGTKGTGAGSGTSTGEKLNIRKGPSTSFDSVAKLSKGDKVEILYQLDMGKTTWGFVKDKGWVSMEYIKMT